MKDRCNECRYKMERHGIVDGEEVYYCDICGIYQSYPLEEEALLAAEKKNCGCGKDPCVTYGAESEKKPEKDHNCIACGHHSAHITMDDNKFCYDCYHYAETFNSYKVAPELSSYTVDELVASKAGPQGSAAYDEMVYDPIAQDRQSAESFSLPKTLLLFGAMAAGLGFGVFLTKKLGDITPETSNEGGA